MKVDGEYNTADIKADSGEESALDQIQEMVDHEAMVGDDNIAIMPDYHWGSGAVIGFTKPLENRIPPDTVGVDIGCFAGETKVQLLDGKDYQLDELAERDDEFCVYSCTEDGEVVIGKATARKTRTDAELVEIELDNGETIRCTPDHEYMMRDGTYTEAEDLSEGDSLMPLYNGETNDGYRLVFHNQQGHVADRSVREHWLVARSDVMDIPKDVSDPVLHHKNFDKKDNRPENLEFMTPSEHAEYHRSIVDQNEHWQSEEFEERRIQALKEREPTEREIESSIENITSYMEENPEEWRKKISGNGERGAKYLEDFNTSERECSICGEACDNPMVEYWHQVKNHPNETEYDLSPNAKSVIENHKVVAVREVDETEDVYCLNVPKHHNFALSAGVFVHNCGMYAECYGDRDFDVGDEEILAELDAEIRDRVPMGFNVHNRGDYHMHDDFPWEECQLKLDHFNENWDGGYISANYDPDYYDDLLERVEYDPGRCANSMGTLGGGNHFIELGLDADDQVWAIIHSGSRGIGASIAEYWSERATKLRSVRNLRAFFKHLTVDRENLTLGNDDLLEYVKFDLDTVSDEDLLDWVQGGMGEDFVDYEALKADYKDTQPEAIDIIGSGLKGSLKLTDSNRNESLDHLEGEEAHGYIRDMIFAQTYASQSRKLMAEQVEKSIASVEEWLIHGVGEMVEDSIESVHNFIDFQDATIRKGACRAYEDERVIIPFNMSYGTLLCRGKGDDSWNNSAPHGAGRAMGRRDAKQRYDPEDMTKATEGVFMSETPLDETPQAYKDPADIEGAIGPTVEVEDRVVPFLNLKAD